MKTGRNDPCPCGSGKKYKQCCLRAQSAAPSDPNELAYRRLSRELQEFNPKLIRFSVDRLDEVPEQPWMDFCGERPAFEEWGDEVLSEVFMTWLCFHRVEEDDALPAARHYLERHQRRLSPMLRSYLQSALETPFSYFQVQSVDPGRSLDLTDLLSGTPVQVRDGSASRSMQVGAICFGKVVQVDGFALFDGVYGHIIPAMRKADIIDLREALKTAGVQPSSGEDYTDELLDHLDHLAGATLPGRRPQLRNQHGEDIEPQVLRYKIESVSACVQALLDLGTKGTVIEVDPQYDAPEDDDNDDGYRELISARLHWMEDSEDGWLLALIHVDPGSIRVEVNSRERAERVREFFSQRMSELAKPQLSEIRSNESLFDTTEAVDRAEIDELNQHPEVQALIEQQLAKHYDSWPDIPLPALGNQAPIEAVKTPLGREKVRALLDGFAGGPMAIPDAIMRKLRERLGLG